MLSMVSEHTGEKEEEKEKEEKLPCLLFLKYPFCKDVEYAPVARERASESCWEA